MTRTLEVLFSAKRDLKHAINHQGKRILPLMFIYASEEGNSRSRFKCNGIDFFAGFFV